LKLRILRTGITLFIRGIEFIKGLSRKLKVYLLGIFISLLSIFIVNSSIKAFIVVYLLGVSLIFISAFIGIEKFNKNTIGEIVSKFGLVVAMLGIFSRVGVVDNIITSNIHLVGVVILGLGIWLKNTQLVKKT
jgi:hypothetical protein